MSHAHPMTSPRGGRVTTGHGEAEGTPRKWDTEGTRHPCHVCAMDTQTHGDTQTEGTHHVGTVPVPWWGTLNFLGFGFFLIPFCTIKQLCRMPGSLPAGLGCWAGRLGPVPPWGADNAYQDPPGAGRGHREAARVTVRVPKVRNVRHPWVAASVPVTHAVCVTSMSPQPPGVRVPPNTLGGWVTAELSPRPGPRRRPARARCPRPPRCPRPRGSHGAAPGGRSGGASGGRGPRGG